MCEDGLLVLEVGAGKAEQVVAVMTSACSHLKVIDMLKDSKGTNRCVVMQLHTIYTLVLVVYVATKAYRIAGVGTRALKWHELTDRQR